MVRNIDDFEDEYYRKIYDKEWHWRGFSSNLIGTFGKYTSFLYGAFLILNEDPHKIPKILLSAAIYTLFCQMQYVSVIDTVRAFFEKTKTLTGKKCQ